MAGIMCRLNLYLLYNAWPDKRGPETWEQRFLWLGRYVLCQCGMPDVRVRSRAKAVKLLGKTPRRCWPT